MLKFSSFEALTSPRHLSPRHQGHRLLRFPDLRQLKFQPTFAFSDSQEPPKSAAEPPKFPEELLYFVEEPLYFPEEPVYPQILLRIHPLICVSANFRPHSPGADSRIAMVVLSPSRVSRFVTPFVLQTSAPKRCSALCSYLACFFASDYLLSAGFKELQIVFKNNFLAVYTADSFNKFYELRIQRFVVSS